jgi:acyl-CoA thioester hydrolase
MADAELLSGFPVVIDQEVRWGDLDAFGHVNNTVFFRFFESARIAYFERIGFLGADGGVGPILHSTNCRFRLPLGYPDALRVGAKVSALEKDRFNMEYRIVSAKRGAVAAEGAGMIVAFDYAKQTKADVPADVVARIKALG